MIYETEKLEFKSTTHDDVYKTVIAFANTDGGTLLIGINNEGEAAPLHDVDDTYTRITNGIRDVIAPDVTIFVKYTFEENRVIRIEIGEGSFKPYYIKSKGLKPSGVYVRQGASSVQASPEQIRQMLKNADGDVFEELRSLEQELTFNACADVFSKNKTEFGEVQYNILGIRNHAQQLYTNLGLLLSEQCEHTVKVAVFADAQNTLFLDRKEFGGSVLRQLEETFDYLQLNNKNRSTIDGLKRADYSDYPKDAIREALLNALIHRDYGYSGSIIINVNENCIEFISIGGLLPGITTDDIRNGISQLRNKKLAEIFLRLNFIEAYGTGIRRIFALYENCSASPTIDVTPNSFKLTLPNMNMATKTPRFLNPHGSVTPQMQKVLDYLEIRETAADDDIQKLLNIKRTRSFTLLKQMSDLGLVRIEGRGGERRIKKRNLI
ncbi:MAG: putative DNA binding domain-containing protein [Oscillospiraceae bacterium]|nr:putative DNA binding domain-containing protein [Oscillospiraceae bacterium]